MRNFQIKREIKYVLEDIVELIFKQIPKELLEVITSLITLVIFLLLPWLPLVMRYRDFKKREKATEERMKGYENDL